MLLGALLDAGLGLDELKEDLAGLGLSDYELKATLTVSHGISGTRFEVLDQGHDRPASNLAAVRGIIEGGELAPKVALMSLTVFQRLAQAEAEVHGITIDEVHFHEIGAIDSLVDIVGFCASIQRLQIDSLYASPLPLGSGSVKTEHGILPVPVPATLALLASARAPVIASEAKSELVTPTGAALLSTLACFHRPAMVIHRVGCGFGAKEFPWPNMVRVWLGEELHPQAELPAHATLRTRARAHEHQHDDGHSADAHVHPRQHDASDARIPPEGHRHP